MSLVSKVIPLNRGFLPNLFYFSHHLKYLFRRKIYTYHNFCLTLHKPLKTVGNMFVVNLAVADLCVTSFVNPFSIVGKYELNISSLK